MNLDPNYPSLNIIVKIFRLFGITSLVIGIILLILTISNMLNFFDLNKINWLLSYLGFGTSVSFLISALINYASAEIICVIINIEKNTRENN